MPVISSAKDSAADLAPEDQDAEAQDAKVPLMGSSDSLVQHLSPDPFAVDAQRLDGEPAGGELQAPAIVPCEFAATLSDTYEPGSTFTVQGPLGPIKVEPPEDAKPGMTLRYRLAPRPDFRVRVPPDGKPGSAVTLQRADGAEICVRVPEGHGPGDSFDVTPPALMVRMPDGAQSGSFIAFHGPCAPDQQPEWFRAQLPEGLEAGNYLTARLPVPKPQKSKPQQKQGWGGAWKAFTQDLGNDVKSSLQLLRGFKGSSTERPTAAE
mmetsp:Transcript_101403/g.295443  ORF Transcript_101403/g.295443 Transcript_101403/m.295443 type:complete len:265 (+) Transcript_101403:40-834(+)